MEEQDRKSNVWEEKYTINGKKIVFNIYRCPECHKDFIGGGENE